MVGSVLMCFSFNMNMSNTQYVNSKLGIVISYQNGILSTCLTCLIHKLSTPNWELLSRIKTGLREHV